MENRHWGMENGQSWLDECGESGTTIVIDLVNLGQLGFSKFLSTNLYLVTLNHQIYIQRSKVSRIKKKFIAFHLESRVQDIKFEIKRIKYLNFIGNKNNEIFIISIISCSPEHKGQGWKKRVERRKEEQGGAGKERINIGRGTGERELKYEAQTYALVFC